MISEHALRLIQQRQSMYRDEYFADACATGSHYASIIIGMISSSRPIKGDKLMHEEAMEVMAVEANYRPWNRDAW